MNINVKGLEPRMNIEQKSQRIRAALSQYFTETQLDSIMLFWEKKYSKEPAFVLRQFINEICTTDYQQTQKKQMVQDIVRQLGQFNNDNAHHHVISKHQQCFECYVVDVVSNIPTASQAQFLDTFKQYILSSNIKKARLKMNAITYEKRCTYITTWLDDLIKDNRQKAHIASSLELSLLKHIASTLYTALCDEIGPVDADNIVTTAVQQRYTAQQSTEIHDITQL